MATLFATQRRHLNDLNARHCFWTYIEKFGGFHALSAVEPLAPQQARGRAGRLSGRRRRGSMVLLLLVSRRVLVGARLGLLV